MQRQGRNARRIAQVLSVTGSIATIIIDWVDNGESWAGAGEGITRSWAWME